MGLPAWVRTPQVSYFDGIWHVPARTTVFMVCVCVSLGTKGGLPKDPNGKRYRYFSGPARQAEHVCLVVISQRVREACWG